MTAANILKLHAESPSPRMVSGWRGFPFFSIYTLICFLVSMWLYVEVGCHTNMISNLRMRALTVSAISLHTAYGTPPCPGAVSGSPTIML